MEGFETIAVDQFLWHEAEELARECGLSVDEVIKQAIEQGLLSLRSAQVFKLRRGKGNVAEALDLLKRAGKGNLPIQGDELPDDVRALDPELQNR